MVESVVREPKLTEEEIDRVRGLKQNAAEAMIREPKLTEEEIARLHGTEEKSYWEWSEVEAGAKRREAEAKREDCIAVLRSLAIVAAGVIPFIGGSIYYNQHETDKMAAKFKAAPVVKMVGMDNQGEIRFDIDNDGKADYGVHAKSGTWVTPATLSKAKTGEEWLQVLNVHSMREVE